MVRELIIFVVFKLWFNIEDLKCNKLLNNSWWVIFSSSGLCDWRYDVVYVSGDLQSDFP